MDPQPRRSSMRSLSPVPVRPLFTFVALLLAVPLTPQLATAQSSPANRNALHVTASSVQGNPCPPLTETEKAKIIAHLSQWIGAPETERLEIEADELVHGTCYRRLAVKGRTLRPKSFFLSPDQRFLSGSLLDMTVDPAQERKQAQEEINK